MNTAKSLVIRRAVLAGLVASLALVAFYFLLVGFSSGSWQHSTELLAQDRFYVLAITAGFGTQVGLFSYMRQVQKLVRVRGAGAMAASGTGASTVSMLACCVHHLGEVLPVLAASGAAIFFEKYRYPVMWLGIAIMTGCGQNKSQANSQSWEKTVQSQQGEKEKITESRVGEAGTEPSKDKQPPAAEEGSKQNLATGSRQKQQQPVDSKPPITKRPVEATFYERRESKGGIEVEVTWVTPEYLRARGQQPTAEQERDLTSNLVFNVALTAHSGNLMTFDFVGSTSLKINGREAGRGTWELVDNDAHHPEGILRFAAPTGEPVKDLTLTIKGLGGVPERVFKWELP